MTDHDRTDDGPDLEDRTDDGADLDDRTDDGADLDDRTDDAADPDAATDPAPTDDDTGTTYSDQEKRAVLRAVASELRGPEASAEAERVAATVQRVSDLYDPDESTTPEEIYHNMRTIFQVVEQEGMDR